MRFTSRLLQACRITLFTRENCGLCKQAKLVLSDVWDKRPFVFREIDIIKHDSEAWRNLYEFDVPVDLMLNKHWQIHISKAQNPDEDPKLSSKAVKLMHRFSQDEVTAKMDTVERS
ncbi:hypothetical protein B0T24DRAFT_684350 [Lasiosphaeria ovina]|uniref:Glutaredoxin-like protein n=1 Tax=Lasiosphaeria ovina TaxID=92902 RepID=A0AAE0JUN8_9PEZI|nr:hypothetical protein B0T24DRAFT_684350 [Lasiosphaeria ovina]